MIIKPLNKLNMKKLIEALKQAWHKYHVSRSENKPKKHKHKLKAERREYMQGTNRYIDGKEIKKKVYYIAQVCEDCKQTVRYGDTHEVW